MSLQHIDWMDVLETGVPEIDSDHRALIDDFNAMVDLLRSGAQREQLTNRLEQILIKLKHHFEIEEDVLRQRGFPRLEAHIEQHSRLKAELEQGLAMVRQSNSSLGSAAFLEHVHLLLVDILIRHDLDYKSHLLHTSGRRDIY